MSNNRKMRDEALRLFGDISNLLISQQQISGPANTRLELYKLLNQVSPLTEVNCSLDEYQFRSKMESFRNRFGILYADIPSPEEKVSHFVVEQPLQQVRAKVARLREIRNDEQDIRIELKQVVDDLHSLRHQENSDNTQRVLSVEALKRRYITLTEALAISAERRRKAIFLGPGLTDVNPNDRNSE